MSDLYNVMTLMQETQEKITELLKKAEKEQRNSDEEEQASSDENSESPDNQQGKVNTVL